MNIISPVIKITVGLLLLTISLLLIGDMLGIVPNQDQSKIDARKVVSESLAIQISSEVGDGRMSNARTLLNTLVKRHDDITSIALKTESKAILIKTDKHDLYWSELEDDRSTTTNIKVPIFNHAERWGSLEVSFEPLHSVWSSLFNGRSFLAMLLFVIVTGFFTYWLFLKRVLNELDPSAVVPDRVRLALDTLYEGLVILDTSERIVFINASFIKKIGLTETRLIGKRLSNLLWEKEEDTTTLTNTKMPWSIMFETQEIPPATILRLRTENNEMFIFDVNLSPIYTPEQKIKGVVVTINDITELEKKNRELTYILERLEKSKEEISRQNLELTKLATRDPLTDLLNRRSLFENLNTLLSEAHAQRGVISCIMLDIDHFKVVNDTYGHAVGDKVIQIFAKILQDAIRPNDIAARYGGEEFVIILVNNDETQAIETAERIRETVNSTHSSELPDGLSISSSFGVSSTNNNIWQSDKLIDYADKGLYVAKKTGRNKVVSYSQMHDHKLEDKVDLEKPAISRQDELKKKESTQALSLELEEDTLEFPLEVYDMIEVIGRTVLLDRLSQALKQASRNDTTLTVLTINIDTIRLVSNTQGHASAEKLRKIIFDRLVETFRSSDSVTPDTNSSRQVGISRSADSEFTAILPDIKQPNITTWIVNRMFEDLAKPVEIDGHEYVTTAAVGGSVYPLDSDDPEKLMAYSSIALQGAILEGRGTLLFYNHEMNELCKRELEVEGQLHQALEKDELYLNYQPIVNMQTGEIDKFEALARWKHPTLGLVSPDTFIEIAENAGTIKSIGSWIVKKASLQLKVWQDAHPNLKMAINLSYVQFNQLTLAEDLIDIIDKAGITRESIIFELTETVLLKNMDKVTKVISKLHAAGFKIALDDFGTGYSSIDYLRKFPISSLKIDHSLMVDFPTNIHDISIVSALISLSHDLDITVVTEGIEKESQLVALRDLGCDEAQGYFISRPLLPADATEFLKSTKTRQMMKKVHMSKNILKQSPNGVALSEILNTPPSGVPTPKVF